MSFQDYSESRAQKLRSGLMSPRVVVGVAVLVVAILACVTFMLFGNGGEESGFAIEGSGASSAPVASSAADTQQKAPVETDTIGVHIGGCVVSPGIVYLKAGSRVADAVDAAGGMTADAAPDALNLARILKDGEKVVVESAATMEARASFEVVASPDTQAAGSQDAASSAQGTSGKVNINTASSSELQTISGIGASKAQKIIDYREKNGAFKTVDDLTNVSGIGEKTLGSIRDAICV